MIEHQQQQSLTREQKEAVGLLSIGTFLEYFDLMLYVHMAVLLNDLFFEPSSSESAVFITAFAFCSSFVFRPIGAIIFGWIGDRFGRKPTVVITTFMMAVTCIIMATLPTYSDIGVKATIAITLCRIVQSISSMGEIVGAKLYVTKTISPPIQYPIVTLMQAFASFGGMIALSIATLVTSYGFNWRNAFWIGAVVAVIGAKARTNLRETPEFANAKLRLKNIIKSCGYDPNVIDNNPIVLEKVKNKTAISLFLMDCTWPVVFYFSYAYCSTILKNTFHYSAEEIIRQNTIVSIADLFGFLFIGYLSYYINPLTILRVKVWIFLILALICPVLLNNITTPFELLLLQSAVIFLGLSTNPASSLLFKFFPVFKRFTCTSMTFALSRSIMYIITSFGIVYLTRYFGHYGLLVIMLPSVIGFAFGLKYFEKLESMKT